MAPFIANNTAGIDSYKWMLFGDDDTVFYVDNALRLLETLDHNMPYILSDHIWFPTDLESRPHPLPSNSTTADLQEVWHNSVLQMLMLWVTAHVCKVLHITPAFPQTNGQ